MVILGWVELWSTCLACRRLCPQYPFSSRKDFVLPASAPSVHRSPSKDSHFIVA